MGFPTIAGVASTNRFDAVTLLNLPASIAAGDLLLAFACAGVSATPSMTWPAGWIQVFSTFLGDGGGHLFECRYKIADGSEGASETFIAVSTAEKPSVVYRITGWDKNYLLEAATPATGSSGSADPPSLTPSWGSADTLWIAAGSSRQGSTDMNTYPANYAESGTAPNGDNIKLGVVGRNLAASSEDPGAFTHTSAPWIASTIAIRGLPTDVSGFPVIAGQASANRFDNPGGTTNHLVRLPGSIASGDLLLAYFLSGIGVDMTITWPGGWTNLFELYNGVFREHKLSARYRIADGSEGASITVTTSAGRESSSVVYRITGWDVATPPEAGSVASNSSGSADPPSLTPSWGALNTLWMAVGTAGIGSFISNVPANYVIAPAAPQGDNTMLAVAGRNLNGASENPGTFSHASAPWIANVIAVKPAVAPSGPGPRSQGIIIF